VRQSPVFGLGFVSIRGAAAEWRSFVEDVLGMMAEHGPDGELLVRMDDRVARFVIEPPATVNEPLTSRYLGFTAGWECRDGQAWQQAAETLEKAGVQLTYLDRARAWYSEAFSCVDPSGMLCEFFYGGKVDPARPFVSPSGVTFVTGGQAMGHITIGTANCRETAEFYEQLLGFQLREAKTTGADKVMRWAFLSPNAREHSLALIGMPGVTRLLHVLVETTELDAVGRAMDRCLDGLAPMTVSIGRHWNDEMVSFYLRTPSGFDIEYGFDGRVVEPTEWTRREQGGSEEVSLWGHRRVRPDGTLGQQIGKP
jgi:3,4-dihydroxy-9,10-secoandrosta-1,3,5(10)-triene-9,17-dione 4,5-dioxygenase